jgi:hypothetical protein
VHRHVGALYPLASGARYITSRTELFTKGRVEPMRSLFAGACALGAFTITPFEAAAAAVAAGTLLWLAVGVARNSALPR